MQRTITINKIHIRNFVISIFLGFILLFILEHKNELTFNSYSDNHNKNEGFTWTTKVYLTDNVSNFKYMSYFGNETSISGNGFTVGDLYDEDAPPKSYMFKLYWQKFILPYWPLISVALVCYVIASAAGLSAPLIIKFLIDDALVRGDVQHLHLIITSIITLYLFQKRFWPISN